MGNDCLKEKKNENVGYHHSIHDHQPCDQARLLTAQKNNYNITTRRTAPETHKKTYGRELKEKKIEMIEK